MPQKENLTLGQRINTACPRATLGLVDHNNGSLEVVFSDNLRKIDMKPQIVKINDDSVYYYAEVQEPAIFSNKDSLQVLDKANYTVIRYPDSSGQEWTIEAYHPKFQSHDLGINKHNGNRTDRFIYAYSNETGLLFISKISLSLRANEDDRFKHDTVSIRLDENGNVQNVRVRINQNTSFKLDSASEARTKSETYHHIDQYDASTVLNTYVNIGTKIVFGDNGQLLDENDRFEDYISIFELIDNYYELPINLNVDKNISPVFSKNQGAFINRASIKNRVISIGTESETVLAIDLESVLALDPHSLGSQQGKTDVERLYDFGVGQIETALKNRADMIFIEHKKQK